MTRLPIMGTLVLILGMGCIELWVERSVRLTKDQFMLYWVELEKRWPVFFESKCVEPPALPSPLKVFNMVTFIEVEASSRFPTCSYRRSTNEIRIGNDKWRSGCVPHEIGHAVCDLLHSRVCKDFEHPDYVSKC